MKRIKNEQEGEEFRPDWQSRVTRNRRFMDVYETLARTQVSNERRDDASVLI